MTPFFWYSVAISALSVMAGMGLMALIMRPWAPRICALAHAPVPPSPAAPRPRPNLLEETTWQKPAAPGPRHVRPRSSRNDDSAGLVSGSTAARPSFVFREDPVVPAAPLTSDYANDQQAAGGGL